MREKFVEHGWDGDKFEVLPHFQKLHKVQKSMGNDGPLIYFGRLSAEKGVDDLLRSMQSVPHLRLIIAGEGPQRGELQELAASLGLSNVKFVGHVGRAERDALIAQSRFTVLPSHAYGRAADLADRLRFLMANPAAREADWRTAKRRIEEQYQ